MSKKSVQPASENEILRLLQRRYPGKTGSLIKGIGDDAAVIHPDSAGEYWLITTDMLVENIDFRREWTTPRRLGRKSISVNLSDLAAMGAHPRFFTVSLGLPPGISRRWITEFYRGLTERGDEHGAQLIGGDLSSSQKGILISITALGESIERKVLYRSGGREGDFLYVTGILGRSAAGLRLLQNDCIHPGAGEAIRSHREPVPRCKAGMWLAHCGMVRCMMDLSDGLSIDLPRLCTACGTGAEIDAARLPLFLKSAAWGFDPVGLALHGGEDFELLFAVPGSKAALFEKIYPVDLPQITRIGKMIRGRGDVWIRFEGKNRRRLTEQGYDHFRRDDLWN
jgi:thiamine-monophosphate kinase